MRIKPAPRVITRFGAGLMGAFAVAAFGCASPAYAAETTLLAPSQIDLGTTAPGASGSVPLRLYASAGQTVAGVTVIFSFFRPGVDLREYGNCTYYRTKNDAAQELRSVACYVAGTVTPGAGYDVFAPDGGRVRFNVAPDAPGPWLRKGVIEFYPGHSTSLSVQMLEADARRGLITRSVGTGDPLRIVTRAIGSPGSDWRETTTSVQMNTTANPYDLQAVGATGTGKVGDIVTVAVGMKNNGPASEYRYDEDPSLWVRVSIPGGTTVVEVPRSCAVADGNWHIVSSTEQLGQPRYLCNLSSLKAGAETTFAFRLEITKVIANATGSVSVKTGEGADPNPANDKAKIVINSNGASSDGGTGSDTGKATSALPVTGANILSLVLAAGACLAIGALLVCVSRRRA